MEQANLELLEQGVKQWGVAPPEGAVDAIIRHLEMVSEWNERINLTAVKDEREMVVKHVIDSISALSVFTPADGMSVLDVGTGAGFPGVPLKCLFPGVKLVLLESLAKRCKFLEAVGEEVVKPLGGPPGGFEVVWGRAEDIGQKEAFRERFDIVLARAVADLAVLAEYCLPFCRVGGLFIALKGPSGVEEVKQAERAIKILGGVTEDTQQVTLPEGAGSRVIVRVRKAARTPLTYPRKAGTPSRRPL